jgi:DNA-binding NarL/FixJ family response regulator
MASDFRAIQISDPLRKSGWSEVVAEAATDAEAIRQFKKFRPDVTLMDLQLPEMSRIEAIIAIRSEFPNARIVIFTTYPGDVQVTRALKAGARAYLLKIM